MNFNYRSSVHQLFSWAIIDKNFQIYQILRLSDVSKVFCLIVLLSHCPYFETFLSNTTNDGIVLLYHAPVVWRLGESAWPMFPSTAKEQRNNLIAFPIISTRKKIPVLSFMYGYFDHIQHKITPCLNMSDNSTDR